MLHTKKNPMTESTTSAPKPSGASSNAGTAGNGATTGNDGGGSGGGGSSSVESNQNDANAGTDEITCQSNNKDIEKGSGTARRSRSRRKHRPLLRRIFHYIQTTWIGGINPKAGKMISFFYTF